MNTRSHVSTWPIRVCPGCSQAFRWRGYDFCCGHCSSNRGHGKNCYRQIVEDASRHIAADPGRRRRSRSSGLRERNAPQHLAPEQRRRRRSRSPCRNERRDLQDEIVPSRTEHREVASCAICLDGPRTHSCVPCGHLVLCNICASPDLLRRLDFKCPICRQDILMAIEIYV